jgi:putative oxidoreductase
MKSLVFGSVRIPSVVANLGLLGLRAFAGFALMYGHGLRKMPPSERFIEGVAEMGFPIPIVFAWSAALSEVVGGVLLALGLATRPAAFFIACTMATAAFIRHAPDPFSGKELSLLFFFTALLFLSIGGGRFSLDRLIQKDR